LQFVRFLNSRIPREILRRRVDVVLIVIGAQTALCPQKYGHHMTCAAPIDGSSSDTIMRRAI